jgi:UTP-glucose-1-phosphate uridylyltransferase
MYDRYFRSPLSQEHLDKLPSQMRAYEAKILEIGKRLTFRIQKERKGFGHAVYQCRDFTENEPVLLLLEDTIYRSHTAKTCSLQLIEAYEKLNRPLVSIHETPLEQVVYYGIPTGTWEDRHHRILTIMQFTEKPTQEYAEDFLSVPGFSREKKYYSVFGQYILTPEVFEQLKRNISSGNIDGREYGLTEALAAVIPSCGLSGVVLDEYGGTDWTVVSVRFNTSDGSFKQGNRMGASPQTPEVYRICFLGRVVSNLPPRV